MNARKKSPSIRREWIEMRKNKKKQVRKWVSLHTEGVD